MPIVSIVYIGDHIIYNWSLFIFITGIHAQRRPSGWRKIYHRRRRPAWPFWSKFDTSLSIFLCLLCNIIFFPRGSVLISDPVSLELAPVMRNQRTTTTVSFPLSVCLLKYLLIGNSPSDRYSRYHSFMCDAFVMFFLHITGGKQAKFGPKLACGPDWDL